MSVFNNKICIVTGAASGIGKALCNELTKNGASVIATDVNKEGLTATVEAIRQQGGKVRSESLDVTDYESFERLIEDTAGRDGRLDYLFNNAGITICGEARDLDMDHWRKVLDVNLHGALHGTLAAYKFMVKQGFGHIVNLASIQGLMVSPLEVPYVASKFAVVGLSQGLWVEGADLGVKVSVVCPGYVKTPMFDTSPMVNLERREVLNAYSAWERFSISPEGCARVILDGVARNKPIILVTGMAKLMWWLTRLFPTAVLKLSRKDFRKVREKARIDK